MFYINVHVVITVPGVVDDDDVDGDDVVDVDEDDESGKKE